MENQDINLIIDNEGNIFIPSNLRNMIKSNMLLTCISNNSLLVISEDTMNNLFNNLSNKEKIKRLRILKANSTRFIMDKDYKINIPDYILDKIKFKNGKVVFNEKGDSFQIIDSNLFNKEENISYGK